MISAVVVASALLAVSTEDVARLLAEREFRYSGGSYHNELFRYRLFVPRSLAPAARYPLLVWLHGLGDEIGSDNCGQLKWMGTTLFADAEPRFFILAVQCPKANPAWFRDFKKSGPDDMLSVTADILRRTFRECPIDPDRVYVTGISGGATGCWEMALRYPEMFAAVVPLGGGGDLSRAARLKDVPVWAFHFSNDSDVPSKDDENMVAELRALGGNAHLTIREAAPGQSAHNCWEPAFKQYKVMSWMLAQRRGERCWLPPGCRPWQWRHIVAAPAGFLAIAWLAWARAKRRPMPLPTDDEADFIVCLPDEKEKVAP